MAKSMTKPEEPRRDLAPASAMEAARPGYLSEADGELAKEMLEGVRRSMQLPRLKTVQKQAQPPYDQYPAGTWVAVPVGLPLTDGKPDPKVPVFYFTPVFQYPEWIAWNPIETKGTIPAIKERTTDAKSELAQKCRDAQRRNEPFLGADGRQVTKDGKPLFVKNLEHLNFVVIAEPPFVLAGTPLTLSFSSGDHKYGSGFSTLIFARNPMGTPKGRLAPPWSMRFAAYGGRQRQNAQGSWFGLDVENPPLESGLSPWIEDEALFRMYEQAHRECADAFRTNQLVTEMDEAPPEGDAKTEAGTNADGSSRF
jgi:hypothetical protein